MKGRCDVMHRNDNGVKPVLAENVYILLEWYSAAGRAGKQSFTALMSVRILSFLS